MQVGDRVEALCILGSEARSGLRLDGDEALSASQQEVDLEPLDLGGRPVADFVVEAAVVAPRAQAVGDEALEQVTAFFPGEWSKLVFRRADEAGVHPVELWMLALADPQARLETGE